MTNAEFERQFSRLTDHFHLPTDSSRDTISVDWFDALKHYHVEALEAAVTELIRAATDRYWPALGRVRELIQARIGRYDRTPGTCTACGGSGWVDAPIFESNRLIYANAVRRCEACGIPEPKVETHARRGPVSEVQTHEYQAGRYGREQVPEWAHAKHPDTPGNPDLRAMIAAFRKKFVESGDEVA